MSLWVAFILGLFSISVGAPDRSQPPKVMDIFAPKPPVIYRRTLSNGIPIWVAKDDRLPLVRIKVLLEHGLLDVSPSSGLHMASMAWRKGPRWISKPNLLAKQALYGAKMSMGVGYSNSWGWVESLKTHSEPSLKLMLNSIFNPKRNSLYQSWKQFTDASHTNVETLSSVHRLAVNRALFGVHHPFAKKYDNNVQLNQVKRIQKVISTGAVSGVVVVGDIEPAKAVDMVERQLSSRRYTPYVQSWEAPNAWESQQLLTPFESHDRVGISVFLPGTTQTDAQRWALKAAVLAMGGTFSSRLVGELRENQGLAYSIGAHLKSYTGFGYIDISCTVSSSESLAAIEAILTEVHRMKINPLSPEESMSARRQLRQQIFRRISTLKGLSNSMASALQNGNDIDYLEKRYQAIESLSVEDISNAGRRLSVTDAIIVVTGPVSFEHNAINQMKARIQQQLLQPKIESDIMR